MNEVVFLTFLYFKSTKKLNKSVFCGCMCYTNFSFPRFPNAEFFKLFGATALFLFH